MMQKKLLSFVVLLAVIQLNKSAPIDDIIASFVPQIQNLEIRIATTIRTAGIALGLTQASIRDKVNAAKQALNGDVASLRALIAQSQADGAPENCINEATSSLDSVDGTALEQCWANNELDTVGVKLGELGHTMNLLRKLIHTCQSQAPADEAALTNCLQNGLSNASLEVDGLDAQIESSLAEAVKNSGVCADSVLSTQRAAIDEIGSELNKCIG